MKNWYKNIIKYTLLSLAICLSLGWNLVLAVASAPQATGPGTNVGTNAVVPTNTTPSSEDRDTSPIPVNQVKSTPPPIIPNDLQKDIKLPVNYNQDNNKEYFTNQLLPNIAKTIISITGGLALIFAIISGLQMQIAYGDDAQVKKAKTTLTYALVGLVLAGLSYGIVAIIASIKV